MSKMKINWKWPPKVINGTIWFGHIRFWTFRRNSLSKLHILYHDLSRQMWKRTELSSDQRFAHKESTRYVFWSTRWTGCCLKLVEWVLFVHPLLSLFSLFLSTTSMIFFIFAFGARTSSKFNGITLSLQPFAQ